MLALAGSVWLYEFLCESKAKALLQTHLVRVSVAVGMLVYLCLCSSGGGAFIYFQF